MIDLLHELQVFRFILLLVLEMRVNKNIKYFVHFQFCAFQRAQIDLVSVYLNQLTRSFINSCNDRIYFCVRQSKPLNISKLESLQFFVVVFEVKVELGWKRAIEINIENDAFLVQLVKLVKYQFKVVGRGSELRDLKRKVCLVWSNDCKWDQRRYSFRKRKYLLFGGQALISIVNFSRIKAFHYFSEIFEIHKIVRCLGDNCRDQAQHGLNILKSTPQLFFFCWIIN